MNADELLCCLQAGGQVTECWKRRSYSIGRPKKVVTLHYADGGQIVIQRSVLKPLIHRGLIDTRHMSGDEYIYRIKT